LNRSALNYQLRMFKTAVMISGLCLFSIGANAQTKLVDRISFASVPKAKALLSQEDAFTKSWSPFDMASRLGDKNATRELLFDHIRLQVREWSDTEVLAMTELFEEVAGLLDKTGMNIKMPENIFLVKTSGEEEGNAVAYTRSNYIVFRDKLDFEGDFDVRKLILHELFHVFSRNDPDFRKKMYDIIGFQLTAPVSYPPNIADLRITNPDAPQTDSYIQLIHKESGQEMEFMMVLYASRPYGGGPFFSYLQTGFVELEGQEIKKVRQAGGIVKIYKMDEVDQFFEQVGRNTQYIIHPEEILADNFAMAVMGKNDVADPWLLDAILAALSQD